jgi:hypothetical protein
MKSLYALKSSEKVSQVRPTNGAELGRWVHQRWMGKEVNPIPWIFGQGCGQSGDSFQLIVKAEFDIAPDGRWPTCHHLSRGRGILRCLLTGSIFRLRHCSTPSQDILPVPRFSAKVVRHIRKFAWLGGTYELET